MNSDSSSATFVSICIDELIQMFSCAICLEILFEPCATRCGHCFCKSCLRSSIYMGDQSCPICRHWISYEDSCSLDIVLWNTITRLFPEEVEARKAIQHLFPWEVETWKAIDVINRPWNLSEQSRRDLSRDLKCMLCGLFVGLVFSLVTVDTLIKLGFDEWFIMT